MPVKKSVKPKKEIKKVLKKETDVRVGAPVVEALPFGPTISANIDPAGHLTESPRSNEVSVGSPSTTREKYFEAMGRRKESIARVRLYTKKATDASAEEKALIVVNGKDYRNYFTDANLWEVVESPLKKLKSVNRFKVTVVVYGGGKSGQADAIKLGIARTLVDFDKNFRKKLKKSGYLTRDPRAKERRKYGLKKARKAPRWAKR